MRTKKFGPPIVPSAVLLLLAASPASAQTASRSFRFGIDSVNSLAWYQVDPHTSLLWATTCPEDPHWRPGDSRNSGWDTRGLPTPKTGAALISDTSSIPLYRRDAARPYCHKAVDGTITADDTVSWQGLHGTIEVDPTKLRSGLPMRDQTAIRDIFQTWKWPHIRFDIDSLGDVTRGDTLRGNIYGKFFLRDVEWPMAAPFVAWRESPGLRVMARLNLNPVDLVEVYGVSIQNMRLALMPGVWQKIHFGVDVVLKPETGVQQSAK